MLVSVDSTNKFDNSTLALDCADEEFEASLYQVLHRTTAKPTAENSETDRGTEGVQSVARDREEIRSEEHV